MEEGYVMSDLLGMVWLGQQVKSMVFVGTSMSVSGQKVTIITKKVIRLEKILCRIIIIVCALFEMSIGTLKKEIEFFCFSFFLN